MNRNAAIESLLALVAFIIFFLLLDLFKKRTVEMGRLEKELTHCHLLFFNDKTPERLTISKRRILERDLESMNED